MSYNARSRTVLLFAASLIAFIGAIGFTRAAAVPADDSHTPRLLPAIVEWSGADGNIQSSEFIRITDAEAWLDLWLRHTGKSIPAAERWGFNHPRVDFERYMVVAVFRGQSVNTRGEKFEGFEIGDKVCLIRYDSASFQTASFDGNPDPGIKAVSYGIWVVPRTTLPLVFEENVQGMLDKDPIWKEQARIP